MRIFVPSRNIYTCLPYWQRGSVSVSVWANAAQQQENRVVSPSSTAISKAAAADPIFAMLEYRNTGEEFENTSPTSQTTNLSRGMWLDSGSPNDVYVERIINSGSLDAADPGVGRFVLNTSRTYGIQVGFQQLDIADVTFNFWNAQAGGSMLGSATVVFTAEDTTE